MRSAFAPMDAGSLVFFRVAFGLIMVWEAARYLKSDWIEQYWIDPGFHFTYYGFGWIEPWPGNGMYVHWWVIGGLGLLIALGLFYRLATILFFLAFTYVFLLDQMTYLNHFHLVCVLALLMIFLPAQRATSLDAWLWPQRASRTVPAWSVWLLRAVLAIVYFYAGIAKLNEDWLRAEPIRDWIPGMTAIVPLSALLETELGAYFMAYGGLLFDLLLAPALLWRRTRAIAFACAVLFHVTNALVFSIGIFPWLMIAATTIFFVPDWTRTAWHWLRLQPCEPGPRDIARWLTLRPPPTPASEHAGPPPESLSGSQRVLCAGIALFLLVQILFPLRHFLYPGTVHWNEEGHRFAWHMKLRDKEGVARFIVADGAGTFVREIDPDEFLTSRQNRKMSTRPDMILQFAHFLAELYLVAGYETISVRAEVLCRLNDRESQLLVDPTVDLAAESRTLGHAEWIVPLHPR